MKTGCHVYVFGLKTNLCIAKLFAQALLEKFPLYSEVIDMGKYRLGETLRVLGSKGLGEQEKKNSYSADIKDIINYLICYTN